MKIYIYDNPKGAGTKKFIYKKCIKFFYMLYDYNKLYTKNHKWNIEEHSKDKHYSDLINSSRKLETWEIIKYKLEGKL